MTLVLYSYWRSTTSLRVRAALNLKGLTYETRLVNLLEGVQRAPDYAKLNPVEGVPTLVAEDGTVLTQSMAILDWLEDMYPDPALLPFEPTARAKVRAAAQVIAMDVHPVNNLKVVGYLKSMGHDQDTAVQWMCHWMAKGFAAYGSMISDKGRFSFGDDLTHADLCLVGQMVNARRWGLDLNAFGRLVDIDAAARALPGIAAAMPENQPDAQ